MLAKWSKNKKEQMLLMDDRMSLHDVQNHYFRVLLTIIILLNF